MLFPNSRGNKAAANLRLNERGVCCDQECRDQECCAVISGKALGECKIQFSVLSHTFEFIHILIDLQRMR